MIKKIRPGMNIDPTKLTFNRKLTFVNGLGDLGSNPMSRHTKDFKNGT